MVIGDYFEIRSSEILPRLKSKFKVHVTPFRRYMSERYNPHITRWPFFFDSGPIIFTNVFFQLLLKRYEIYVVRNGY
jgi:hypothetical protein